MFIPLPYLMSMANNRWLILSLASYLTLFSEMSWHSEHLYFTS